MLSYRMLSQYNQHLRTGPIRAQDPNAPLERLAALGPTAPIAKRKRAPSSRASAPKADKLRWPQRDPTTGRLDYGPPKAQQPYDEIWPVVYGHVQFPSPSIYNRQYRLTPVRRARARLWEIKGLPLDDYGNHIFTPGEVWECYSRAHAHGALQRAEYTHFLAACVRHVDPSSADGAAWVERCEAVAADMDAAGWPRTAWEWTLLMQAYARAGRVGDAEAAFAKMAAAGITPLQVSYGALIRAHALDAARPEPERRAAGEAWFGKMVAAGVCGAHVPFEKVWEGMTRL